MMESSFNEERVMPDQLLPWRKVIQPHLEVYSGRYSKDKFAADLAAVMSGEAQNEYRDPYEFFRRTYLTEGLINLLVMGYNRLRGLGGNPVVQLQTNFGGGKTHSMLALYHMSDNLPLAQVAGGAALIERIGDLNARLKARRAVFVGSNSDATKPRQYPDCTVNTMWGDLAYQIGGLEAYDAVRIADQAGVSPGAETMLEILERHSPVLIIIDELIAYARNIYGNNEKLPSGSFDSVMTFMQVLTEAVKRSSRSLLLISIPDSNIEIGGEGGRSAQQMLAKIVGRVESVWKPITPYESFAIVRRRLFTEQVDEKARDAVIRAFHNIYKQNKSEFPLDASNSDYLELMRQTYPIHPELMTRLYEHWATLENFQRTRGLLSLMAAVIHQLWQSGNQDLMIMPSSVPLDDAHVRDELLGYLPDNWGPIVDSDVDGDKSKAYQIDREVQMLGNEQACRRVARAIFMASAPATQQQRGIDEKRIRLAVVQPNKSVSIFNDALHRLSNESVYLYTDGTRYWYDTRPTVNRVAEERAQMLRAEQVCEEARRRLRELRRPQGIRVHVAPRESGDVPDEQEACLIVLDPRELLVSRMTSSEGQSKVKAEVRKYYETRGDTARVHRNMLLFIAPEARAAANWESALRSYLAWQSIKNDREQLNLDAQQERQVEARLKEANETVEARMNETYSLLIVPMQRDDTVEFVAYTLKGTDDFYRRAMSVLNQDELLIRSLSSQALLNVLKQHTWGENQHWNLKQLWGHFTQYVYFPRLLNGEALLHAVRESVKEGLLGYARRVRENGKYEGLVLGSQADVQLSEEAVIVRPEVARAQLEAAQPAAASSAIPFRFGLEVPERSASSDEVHTAQPLPIVKRRYHGRVKLNPLHANAEMSSVVEEILKHFLNFSDAQVELELEISARRAEGFDESLMRDINENSRSLKFTSYGFEED
ncbi:MAG: hypothetical protein CUN49_09450 [Candidatus Thermofonsia Clade 1 bacterium]|uniref:Uncharacterized protein n=1 Tax=Candidatus Thermofonsia Clade 1 bacterium TaxID=2364210 RepID=A0A2M8PDL9_9CHLR|nr:MAG: hypothetical protein CUN49_09450 [Candidatus Thermofonsia Clade 1 bacterium]PJF42052.1 MAG: hypothetical protein CUN50_05595 [Candidatus Thermofonsia Clade 1 bacterium]RMF53862.1 MAG: ATP-binding protein [Chloroflexota bacterium]